MGTDSIPLGFGETREVGPRGKLTVVRYDVFDPRDIHEMQPRDAFTVHDGRTGQVLMMTGRYGAYSSTAAFEPEGGLRLTIGRLGVRIDPDTRTWTIDQDGAVPQPLDGDQAKVDAVLGPALQAAHPPAPSAPPHLKPTAGERSTIWLQALGFAALIGIAGWLLATQGWKPHLRSDRAESGAIDAWLVTCPGMSGLLAFSINPDGTLSTPPEIARVPLPVAEGALRTFRRDDLTIGFEGRDVVIDRDGEIVRCTPPAASR